MAIPTNMPSTNEVSGQASERRRRSISMPYLFRIAVSVRFGLDDELGGRAQYAEQKTEDDDDRLRVVPPASEVGHCQ